MQLTVLETYSAALGNIVHVDGEVFPRDGRIGYDELAVCGGEGKSVIEIRAIVLDEGHTFGDSSSKEIKLARPEPELLACDIPLST